MALTAFLLARAETGQIKAAGKGGQLVNAAGLNPLRAELESWGLAEEVESALLNLWQNGWLAEEQGGLLRPTPAAYSWLQLPPALSQLVWLEEPLDQQLAANLINYGVGPDDTNLALLRRLALLGLLNREDDHRYRAVVAARNLILALSRLKPAAPPDDPTRLELAHACQICFPGNLPAKGWLRWQPAAGCFSFAKPVLGQPFSFHPWQLFRLLILSRPAQPVGAKAGRFYCRPDKAWLAAALRGGLPASHLPIYLGQGLRGELPEGLAQTIQEWLGDYRQLVVKDLTILEAASPELMGTLVADRTVRAYLRPLLSSRHAVVDRVKLRRLATLLERRGFYLHSGPDTIPGRAGSKLVMTHLQLQELYTGLAFYHWYLTQSGLDSGGAALLLELLQKQLSDGELAEAMQVATSLVNETVSDGAYFEPPPGDVAQLRQELEAIVEQEGEVWVEYYVPYRAPQKRRLKPHQIYNYGEEFYWIAYCYLRGGEREFRLDRLRLIPPSPQE